MSEVGIRLTMERLQVLADRGRTLQQLLDVTKETQELVSGGFEEHFTMSWVVLYEDACYVVDVCKIPYGYHVDVCVEGTKKIRCMDIESDDLNEFIADLKGLIGVS